jgi:hypothetical protein
MRAISAEVLVLVAIRQNEQEAFTHGHSLTAAGAEEGSGFKLFIGRRLFLGRAGAGRFIGPYRIHLAPTSSLPLRDAGGKGSLGNKAQKPAWGKEGPPPFLARRMLFCPGREPLGHTASLLSIETIQNMVFSESKRVFFLTKLEMVLYFIT